MNKLAYGRRDLNRNNLKQDVEMNPKTLHLEKLVPLIEEHTLSYYLEQVSMFLKSNKKDLWFPNISEYLDAFLVRSICDVQNFECLLDVFDTKSKEFAKDIIESLKENANVFRLVHCYETRKMVSEVLVYRKLYLDQYDTNVTKQNQKMGTEKQPTKDPSDSDSPDARQGSIPTAIKTHWLNIILKFIKDDTVLNFESPQLPLDEAEFIYSLIRPEKLSEGFKAACAPLVDALNVCSATFELKASFLYVSSNRVSLSIEKVPHNNNNKTEKKSIPNVNNTSKSSETDSDSPMTKTQKAFMRKKKLIESLEKYFMKNSLQLILDFMTKEEEASLVFKNANEEQCLFLQSSCVMAKSNKFHTLFDMDIRAILEKMADWLAVPRDFEVKIDIAKLDKKSKLRTVKLTKEPKKTFWTRRNGLSESKNWRSESIQSKSSIDTSNASLASSIEKTEDILSTKEANKSMAINNQVSKLQADTTIDEALNSEIRPESSIDTCKLEDKALTTIDKEAKSEDKGETKENVLEQAAVKNLGPRKTKLLAAMSTPVESNIAMRMMRQMGYQGGPLGVRGEGIVEPIIPALHLASKAGLGCEIQEKKKKPTNAFRLILLQEILVLLEDDVNTIEVQFPSPLTKKEIASVTQIVKKFNNGKDMKASDEVSKELINKIMKVMHDSSGVDITFKMSNDNRDLMLTKQINPKKINNYTSPPTRELKQELTETLKSSKPITINMLTTLSKTFYPLTTKPNKMRDAGFNVAVLYKILELLNSKSETVEVKFTYNLSKKNKNYVRQSVNRINRRKNSYKSSIEMELVKEALGAVKDYKLEVVMNSNLSFILYKRRAAEAVENGAKDCDIANNNTIIKENTKNISDIKERPPEKLIKETGKDNENYDIINGIVTNNDDTLTEENNDLLNAKDVSLNKTSSESRTENDACDPKDVSLNDNDLSLNDNSSAKFFDWDEENKILNAVSDKIEDVSVIKRNRSNSVDSNKICKKTKLQRYLQYISIQPANEKEITRDKVVSFQNALSMKVDETEMPLLECHGIRNGVLIYGCHNETASVLLESVASEMDLKTTDITSDYKENKRYKMKMKFNSFIRINLKELFTRIELFNVGLSTDFWSVLDVETYTDFIIIHIKVDDISFEYICEANFNLFAGIDKVRFSITWD